MFRFRLKFLFILLPVFLFLLLPVLVFAETPGGSTLPVSAADQACQELADSVIANCLPGPNGYDCTPAFIAQTKANSILSKCESITITSENLIKIAADKIAAEAEKTFLQNIAGAWKAMLNQFAKQFAYDTATWIASGGKGQKPLFITEGIGAYLKNTADDAAGTFIDEIDKEFGVNLCRPNFNVELMIKTSIRGNQIRKPSCNFTSMVKNWRSAIKDANFSVEYSNYLNANENDIGIYLTTNSALMDKVVQAKQEKGLEGLINGGFKDLKNLAGWVLTPGTMVREEYSLSKAGSNKANETYTGTVWDFVETFLNTLVGQLLQNLKNGFFTSSSDNGGDGFNLPDLSRLAALLNPEASPYVEGAIGASERFLNLVEGDVKVGGPYDILVKLLACSDKSKTNPGPTDCVVDPILAQAIREKKLVKNLPASILNRQFILPLDNINPQESFSLRNIVILRKYRIVPVGWEIAARYLSLPENAAKNYTLGQIMNQFNDNTSSLKGLIDPQWVMKAPELFCRREGYGEHNILATEQNKGIRRDNYCADEQQCVSEDASGNCTAYGYCTEERKVWNLNSTKCEARFNTCQTFQSKNGTTGSYLANTLDYKDCSSQSAGCRWYSTFYNPIDSVWTNSASEKVLQVCDSTTLKWNKVLKNCTVSGDVVPQWAQTKYTASSGVVMATACTTAGGCDYRSESCTILAGGVKCSLDKCLSPVNLLAAYNGGFELTDKEVWDARFWVENYQNNTNRHFRTDTSKKSGSYALESLSFNNINPLQSTLVVDSGIVAAKNYKLVFYARGAISQGNMSVKIYSSATELGNKTVAFLGENWQEFSINFSTRDLQADGKIELRIITEAGTTGTAYLDDFDIREVPDSCAVGDVWLTLGSKDQPDSEIYFDRDVQTCNPAVAGCSQFIRTRAGLGSNLLPNPSFELGTNNEADLWGIYHGSVTRTEYINHSGGFSMKLDSKDSPPAVYQTDYTLKAGDYMLSAWVLAVDIPPNADIIRLAVYNGADVIAKATKPVDQWQANTWQRLSTPIHINNDNTAVNIRAIVSETDVDGLIAYFDDFQLEKVSTDTDLASVYTPYDPADRPAAQLTYLKKAPSYYDCYLDPQTQDWPIDIAGLQRVLGKRNPACANYSSVCIASEMDCELYTPVNGDPAVPGTITSADVCPAVCAGYQVYKQESTSFTSSKYEQFINKAPLKTCSAAAAGCDEFTNLDEVAKGGEALEYYTQFRVCQKRDAYTDQASYYTWEGSDTTGYQLRVFNLKRSNDTASNAPCTNLRYPDNGAGQNVCADSLPSNNPDENSGACLATDLNSNPDCREFYDTSGSIHYRLLSRVIYVDDNCHPYRRTQTQNDIAEAASDCRNNQGYWNANNECIYMAIPQQGQTCVANFQGCREYTGNKGNSFKNIFLSDFESGAMGWQGGTISSESTHPGGNSLTNSSNGAKRFSKTISVQKGKTYAISFWAKGGNNFNLNSVAFSDAPAEKSFIIGHPEVVTAADILVPIDDQWNLYDLGPIEVTWGDTANYFEQNIEINIPSSQTIYIDNILLKELPQSVYAIENSWFTPFACDNNADQPNGTGDVLNPTRNNPGKMIGCQEYRDRSNRNWFLKSFENLCRADAVGCEQLIDTYNSNAYLGGTFNNNDSSKIVVPDDTFVYMVNDPKYGCGADDKGCSAVGLPAINNQNEVVGYSTTYLKNQPDRYATDLCQANALWCEEFIGSKNISYFKDPRGRICEYKTADGKWYKKGTEQPCDVTYLQTLGNNAKDNKVQPIGWFNSYRTPSELVWPLTPSGTATYDNWVGACPTDQNNCTEYIDPTTDVYKNEILNVDLTQQTGDTFNHWSSAGTGLSQDISLMSHTLYSFSASNVGGGAYIKLDNSCNGIIVSPDASMDIVGGNQAKLKSASGRFYIINDAQDTCTVKVVMPTKIADPKLRLVKSGVYYSLSSKVDYTSCNGLVDYNSGCVLFNDRGSVNYAATDVKGRNVNYLVYDASATYNNQLNNNDQKPITPISPTAPNTGDSNVILKVQPDRACYSFLYCTTYIKDDSNSTDPIYGNNDKCLDLGLCASVDEKGVCNNFIVKSGNPVEESYTEKDANKTGYVSVGYKFPDNKKTVAGFYPYYEMLQSGNVGAITNGSFESLATGSAEPLGWNPFESIEDETSTFKSEASGWHDYKFSVATDSKDSPDGSRYLILNSFYEAISEEIDVFGETPYILAGWINTTGLNYPDQSKNVLSRIQYSEHIIGSSSFGEWKSSGLSLPSGISWTRLVYELTTSKNVDKIRIRLISTVDGLTNPVDSKKPNYCEDHNKLTDCALGGTALFDDISLKPALQVSESAVLTEKYVSRSCRLYPAEDSLSCRYLENNKLFYGNYGYCLLTDPSNPKQCLQWWPVDQLQGEVLNEIGGYNDRVPLDYCVDKKKFNVSFSELGVALSLSSRAQEVVTGFSDINTGQQMNFTPFRIKDDYRSLFRFPYVDRIKISAFGIGLAEKGSLLAFMIPVNHEMVYDTTKSPSEWKGWAAIPVCINFGGLMICVPIPIDYDIAVSGFGDLLSTLTGKANGDCLNTGVCFGPLMGVKVIDDKQASGISSGGASDPIPDLDGDILGVAWFVRSTSKTDLVAVGMNIAGNFEVNYCDSLVRVVNSAGENKAYSNRVTSGSGYINKDLSARHIATEEKGNYYYYDPFDYNKFIKSVSSDILGATTVLDGGGFFQNIFSTFTSIVSGVIGVEPFQSGTSGSVLEKSTYQSSDYQPFGAIVAPSSSPNPSNWSSRKGVYNTPLLYEPPRIAGFKAPYQTRMGEVHSKEGLQQLFAQSYGGWQWKWNECVEGRATNNISCTNNNFISDRGGVYVPFPNGNNYLTIPDKECIPLGTTRDKASNKSSCYIKPIIKNITINNQINPVIDKSVGLAKLSFNTIVDPDQLPLTAYTIDWGDSEKSRVSGVSLRNRTNEENPFLLYHLYDYWKIKASIPNSCDNDKCNITVSVIIYDNWGKSNSAQSVDLTVSRN